MTTTLITIDDLSRIITASAGTEAGVRFDETVLDTPLADLGYDSLALLETVSRIEREYGVTLDEDAASADVTIRELLAAVNGAAS